MFIHGITTVYILSGFIWETNVKLFQLRQIESFTGAARCLEAFIAKNYTLLVFSCFKKVIAGRVGVFLNCIFTFTQPHLCEVLKLINKSNNYNFSACLNREQWGMNDSISRTSILLFNTSNSTH